MITQTRRDLRWLVDKLDACAGPIDESTAHRLLSEADLTLAEVAPYVQERSGSYNRCCVARREHYELLVLTWTPSQGSVAHDHSGSLCGLKVIEGQLTEQLYEQGPDGQVRRTSESRMATPQITVDPGVVIHALANEPTSEQRLVTVHIYSPPLPEIRRYAIAAAPPRGVYTRRPRENARRIVIIGGGFTGTMTMAHLLRLGERAEFPLHIVLVDRQPAFGEGVAYRTNDPRHLLNVPAERMSAWPDRPRDFLEFAQGKDAAVKAGDFLPRRIYAQYLRKTVDALAEASADHLSVEIIRDEAATLSRSGDSRWNVTTAGGREVHADVAVIALGHRPPDDPLARRWTGPRLRFVADPWAALVLSQIGRDEPVLLLGTGLTAIDAILTLDRPDRTAPIVAVSRRGLLPAAHSPQPEPAADLSDLLSQWLDPAQPLTIRRLVSELRSQVTAYEQQGVDWRLVIDGLRPAIPKIWQRLSTSERSRFLRRIRPFWEIHRHRMAPQVADNIERLRAKKLLDVVSGSLLSAAADKDGVDVVLDLRGGSNKRKSRFSWVINCTGPGVHNRHTTHPILRPLLENGTLCEDALSLGLITDSLGRAVNSAGDANSSLLIAGTLRKSTLWESTAVPELRQQAQTIAETAMSGLRDAPARMLQK